MWARSQPASLAVMSLSRRPIGILSTRIGWTTSRLFSSQPEQQQQQLQKEKEKGVVATKGSQEPDAQHSSDSPLGDRPGKWWNKQAAIDKPQGRLVILGCGWGAFPILQHVNQHKYDVIAISPRNHFLFTPLLPSTSVGTVEFRCIVEPIRSLGENIHYFQAATHSIDFEKRELRCKSSLEDNQDEFIIEYDRLVIACGAVSNTFGTPGVQENAYFLKSLSDARRIRQRVLECFEHANQPGVPIEVKRGLLHFGIVGGGPTGVEFSAELHDFIVQDVARLYPSIRSEIRMTVYDVASKILTSFDSHLGDYATQRFQRIGIKIRGGTKVKELQKNKLILESGEEIDHGMVVWSTGVAPNALIQSINLPKDKAKRLITNEFLEVLGVDKKPIEGVYALGDCATIQGNALPATAQVASQQGNYLYKQLNRISAGKAVTKPFAYHHFFAMAYVGGWRALIESKHTKSAGALAWLGWRSAYWTKSVSWKNKCLIPMYWFLTWIFGRDVSRF